ncbi:hypothetical protein E2C01_021402 [Portunus trituberculatus]|uniref:Uncharacterized protein n=1 Tax=Portunus trituberculatus TaxID=210409 RepID=A0A5B7E4V3_PORTR|nr:hypothetical protein [Portunus trituberculatus]
MFSPHSTRSSASTGYPTGAVIPEYLQRLTQDASASPVSPLDVQGLKAGGSPQPQAAAPTGQACWSSSKPSPHYRPTWRPSTHAATQHPPLRCPPRPPRRNANWKLCQLHSGRGDGPWNAGSSSAIGHDGKLSTMLNSTFFPHCRAPWMPEAPSTSEVP